jgi:hypothetical protein
VVSQAQGMPPEMIVSIIYLRTPADASSINAGDENRTAFCGNFLFR